MEELAQRARENANIRNGQVQAFGAGRRNDVSGVACQKERAKLHRFRNETAHFRDVLLQYGPSRRGPAIVRTQSAEKLLPDSIVGPMCEILVGCALQVETRYRG